MYHYIVSTDGYHSDRKGVGRNLWMIENAKFESVRLECPVRDGHLVWIVSFVFESRTSA